MTHEEAKKMGATHYYDVCGRAIRYVKFENGQALYYDTWRKIWLCCNMPYALQSL